MTSENKRILPQTIMVFCPNWVGDVVMATPIFHCLRQNFPDARLVGLIRNYARGVVEDGPWFDQLISVNDKTWRGFIDLVKKIRSHKPDLAVVLPHTFRSALIARMGGAARIFGYRRNFRSFLLTDGPCPRRNGRHITPVPMVDYYLEICRKMKLTIDRVDRPRLYLSDEVRAAGDQLLLRYGIGPEDTVIGLNPGAQYGSSKCWPPQYFANLAELLEQRWKCRLLLFIGPGEESIGEEITRQSKANIVNTGPDRVDLALLKPLVERCQLLVTNDTGPRHYAVAFDVPVVVIMGPTDPRYTHANLEKTIVLRHDLNCAHCHLKECPVDHGCMRQILPDAVMQAAEGLLQERL